MPNIPPSASFRIISHFRKHGEAATAAMLRSFIGDVPRTFSDLERLDLDRLADFFVLFNVPSLAAISWCGLIQALSGPDEIERRAFLLNDLGSYLLAHADERSIQCFISALRLTRSPGRRMRTLGRLGDAHALIQKDWDRAERFYRAAILVGDKAGYNPLHIEQARMRLREVQLDRDGRSQEFQSLRADAAKKFEARSAFLRDLRVPQL